ncbi:ATP-binding protein [Flavobacterium sp. K77]|uniref:ATP-binding protein n=1 Tax=Flavobacterium sp. K77 TaxID=2910676 RepID=UPI001F466BA6|nr:ATP-binding protein [Flavobacterium sp. K77]MCF6141319.1 ATP-binding protein [Flavobacterium sp. K77]
MKIKSIVNDSVANLLNCESEAIHIPGTIQTHGFLLAVTQGDYTVAFCSENCVDFLNKTHIELLGKKLETIFEKADIENIQEQFKEFSDHLARPFIINYNEKTFHVTAHKSDKVIILEFEPFTEAKIDLPDLLNRMQRFTYHTERSDNLQSLCQNIADETRSITGYDRVMIYRFDKEYNGQVFAESKKEDLKPFLHLNYPHTDIPSQARELYLSNLVRMLVDVNYTPAAIFTVNDEANVNRNLDLSLSNLRSMSPIHLEYLKNMEVGATFVISIIHHKKLWGLISCHHYSPKHIPYYTRLTAHLQAIFLSSQIDVRQAADEFELAKEIGKKVVDFQNLLTNNPAIITKKDTLSKLKDLINADGVILHYNEENYTEGNLPSTQQIDDLINWLKSEKRSENFNTHQLHQHYAGATKIANSIAGVMYLPLSDTNKSCIVWTRREVEKSVDWGGDPSKAIQKNEENLMLSPRKSFEVWKQVVKLTSEEWKTPELKEAEAITIAIQRQLHLADLRIEEERYLNLNQKLQKANDELENMNWISTHDLKEPLRKIQFYGSIILERDGTNLTDSVKENILRMQKSAGKMQILIDDLLTYSKVMNEEKKLDSVNLNEIIEGILLDFKESIEEKNITIELHNLPTMFGIQFQLRQLFLNLISNSIKFTRPEVAPVISISAEKVNSKRSNFVLKEFYKIIVKDNGKGFDAAYEEKVFKIFQRLHSQTEFMGTGIGLSICKKIVELHDGYIEAEGIDGVGATFSVYFPVEHLTITHKNIS